MAAGIYFHWRVHCRDLVGSKMSSYRCYILIFPPYSVFPPEKWVYTEISPPEKWVYTEFSPRKSKYVLTHTHFMAAGIYFHWRVHCRDLVGSKMSSYRCYILIFPPYSVFPPEKWVYTEISPPEKWVYTEFSPRKSKYVLTHTHFSPHTSFSPLLF